MAGMNVMRKLMMIWMWTLMGTMLFPLVVMAEVWGAIHNLQCANTTISAPSSECAMVCERQSITFEARSVEWTSGRTEANGCL